MGVISRHITWSVLQQTLQSSIYYVMCFNITIFGWLLIKTELLGGLYCSQWKLMIENNNIFLKFLIENMFLEAETKWNCMNGKCNITSSLRSSICHD